MAGEEKVLESATTTQTPAATPTPATPAPDQATPMPFVDEYSPDPNVGLPAASTTIETVPPKQVTQEGTPPAEALNADNVPAKPVDGQPAADDKGPIPYERFKEVNDKVGDLAAKVDNFQRMAEFYQQQYNELVAQTQGAAPATAPVTDPNAPPANAPAKIQLPPNIKGPETGWDTPDELAAYVNHSITTATQPFVRQELEQVYKTTIAPQMQAMNKWMGAIEEMVVRAQHADFDEVTQAVMAELFVTDHEGKIWNDPQGNPKVKNQALLNWFRQSPSPRMALYNYGVSKRAPEKIADTVKTTTENLLKEIDRKPKGPTMPRQATPGASSIDDVPAQDAPKEVVDAWLKRKNLL